MARSESEIVVRQLVTLGPVAAATGWKTVIPLDLLGVRGRIVSVKARQPVGGDFTTASFYIADSTLAPMTSAAPEDEYTVFKEATVACTASATDAFMAEYLELDGRGHYYCKLAGNMGLGINVTAAAGVAESSLIIEVIAKVQG